MSLVEEEEVEFQDLLTDILTKNGSLAKIKAQLRASVCLALDEDVKLSQHQPMQNHQVKSYLETPQGKLMFHLVREFLEFFNLDFTISVYEPESYMDTLNQYEGREKLAKDLQLSGEEEPTVPLLQRLLNIAQKKIKVLDINLNMNKSENEENESSCTTKDKSLINGNLNATFKVNSPTVTARQEEMTDTFEEASSLTETSVKALDSKGKKGGEFANKPARISNDILPSLYCKDLKNKPQVNSTALEQSQFDFKTFEETLLIQDDSSSILRHLVESRVSEIPIISADGDDTYEDTSSIAEDSGASEKVTENAN